MVMTKAIYHARRETSAAPLRVAPPPAAPPLPAADIPPPPPDSHVALRDAPHVLPNVGAESLEDVLRYCYFHTSKQKEKMIPAQVTQWDDRYVRVDPRRLCELASAAYYLDIRDLVDLTCRAIAAIISGKTAEQIRTTFNIENDLVQSLTGMIQLDDHTMPSAHRSSPSSRGRRQGRHDQSDKAQGKKAKTYSLSAIDDVCNDAEERPDAPQLGTHSVDEVEKWINGPDPAKGNGKRRKKKKKHKSSTAVSQSEPQPPEPTPLPQSSTPPSPPLSSPPPSPSSSSVADPPYTDSASPRSPSPPLKARENGELPANGNTQADYDGANGLHEGASSKSKLAEVIILSSDDDEVVIVSEKRSTPSEKGGQGPSQSHPQRQEAQSSTTAAVKSERDVTVKSEQAPSPQISRPVKTSQLGGKEEDEKEEPGFVQVPQHQSRKLRLHVSSDESINTSANEQVGEKDATTGNGAPPDLRDCRLDDASRAERNRVKDETEIHQGPRSGVHLEPEAAAPKEEPRTDGQAAPKCSIATRHRESGPNGTRAGQVEDTDPAFIRCPDRMDKEVEDFENRLNSSDAPTSIDIGLTGNQDPVMHHEEQIVREMRSEPSRITVGGKASNTGRESIAEARHGAKSTHYDARLRLMQNKLEQTRREAQLQERKRHFEERADDINKQIADLISEREKVRDGLSLVKMELMQLEKERSS